MRLLHRLVAALAAPTIDQIVQQRLREAVPSGLFDAEDLGWRRLTGSRRDLAPVKHDRMLEVAHYLYDQNPLGKWLCETTRNFIVAEGISVQAEDEDVQTVITRFWDDPINLCDLKLPQKVLELGIWGEQCWPVFVNETTGLVRLATVDPSRIREVVHDPDNAESPIGVTLRGRGGQRSARLRVTYPVPDDELFADRALQQRAEEFVDGDCFWFKINTVSTATRGRSDLFAVGDWIDGYEQFLFNTLDRTGYLNAFVWDVLLKGMDETQIREWQRTNPPPKPGSVFAHNEQIEMHATTPDLGASDTAEHARTFRNHVLGSLSWPEHFYGGAGDVNLATAQAMGPPTFKRLQARGRLVRYIVEVVVRYQLAQAVRTGALAASADLAFEVAMPQMVTEDLPRIAAALQQLTAAAAIAEDRGWVDAGTAQRLFAALAGRLGVEVPLMDAVTAAAEAQVTRDYRRRGSPVAGNGSTR